MEQGCWGLAHGTCTGSRQWGEQAASTPTPTARSARFHMKRCMAGLSPCACIIWVTTAMAASATSLRPPASALSTTSISSSQPCMRAFPSASPPLTSCDSILGRKTGLGTAGMTASRQLRSATVSVQDSNRCHHSMPL